MVVVQKISVCISSYLIAGSRIEVTIYYLDSELEITSKIKVKIEFKGHQQVLCINSSSFCTSS